MSRKHASTLDSRPWTGPTRHYDIFKEGAIALLVVSVLTLALAALFSSPDDPAVTFKGWATDSPDSMYATAVSELAGTSESASYGPPYNDASDGLSIGPLFLQKWGGVTHPYDAANDIVITPLSSQEQPADVAKALDEWTKATADQQSTWATNYDTALNDPAGADGDATKVPQGEYGPVPTLAKGLVAMAAAGAYDGILLSQGKFFQTDNTIQLLFMGDGGYMEDRAVADHLGGDQWGQVNEAGSFPGQLWLAGYAVWYQLPAFNADSSDPATPSWEATLSDNADSIIFAIVVFFVLVFLFLPFIPGLRSIPRWIPLHRLVWRQYYKKYGRA